MNLRHVYLADSLDNANRCVVAARSAGLSDEQIALVARSDIALTGISDDLKEDSATDFIPATLRGAIGGGAVGLIGGLVAAAIPTLGITLAGAGLFALTGAAIGTWSSSLVGAAVPNEVHRKFEQQIEDGRVLVVLDVEEDAIEHVDALMRLHGAVRFDYETHSALT